MASEIDHPKDRASGDHTGNGAGHDMPSDFALRVRALQSLLVEEGLIDPAALVDIMDTLECQIGTQGGPRVATHVPPPMSNPFLGGLTIAPRAEPPIALEPGQARALALMVACAQHVTWSDITTAISEDVQAAAARGEAHEESRHFEFQLRGLERVLVGKGLVDPAALDARQQAWANAYRTTPPGRPVKLPCRVFQSGGIT